MKIKYSGPPFYHFKVGIITPGVQEIEDEWALKLLKAGIVENYIDEIVGAGGTGFQPVDNTARMAVPPIDNPALSAVPAQAGTGEPDQWVEGLAQPVAEDVLEEAERTGFDSRAPEPKRRKGRA